MAVRLGNSGASRFRSTVVYAQPGRGLFAVAGLTIRLSKGRGIYRVTPPSWLGNGRGVYSVPIRSTVIVFTGREVNDAFVKVES